MEVNSLYMEFLKANYSNVANRLSALSDTKPSGSTPEEIAKSKAAIEQEFNSLANDSERRHKFEIWEKVPTIIRDRYNGQVPPEIMEAAERDEIYVLREIEYHPEKKNIEEVRRDVEAKYGNILIPSDLITEVAKGAFAAAVVHGYCEICASEMARERQTRDNLYAKLENNTNLTPEEKKQIRNQIYESKKKTIDAIRADWGGGFLEHDNKMVKIKPNQPEKMLFYMLREFNKGEIDKDKLVSVMAYLQPYLRERQPELLEFMQTNAIQSRMRTFKDETRDLLAHYVLNELPDDVRAKVMENAKKRSPIDKSLTKEQQAMAVAKNMSATKANVLPQKSKLSPGERMANMPSALNRGMERQA